MNTKISANQNGHNHPKIVNAYASARSLTKPEAAVLELIATYDHRDAMLDIGIGAGRTIPYFSPLFKSYVGIDYAESMVNYCRSHFDISNAVFQYQDARDLSGFHNDSFDFVQFSYNGIDYVNTADRQLILNEIVRVLKNGGTFFFSTHNLYGLQKLRKFNFKKNPYDLLRELRRCHQVRKQLADHGNSEEKDFLMINEGGGDFKFEYCYIKPEKQIVTLKKLGFNRIRTFSSESGEELGPDMPFEEHLGAWVYYLCQIVK